LVENKAHRHYKNNTINPKIEPVCFYDRHNTHISAPIATMTTIWTDDGKEYTGERFSQIFSARYMQRIPGVTRWADS
jgi:hypothetical protein